MNAPDLIWNRLTAARKARPAQAEAGNETAPFGFATRVVALWRETREADRQLALWQRVSWRAAIASLALCGLVALAQRAGTSSDTLLEPPALDLPTFASDQ
jgi:anti-sigma-K factor RskA